MGKDTIIPALIRRMYFNLTGVQYHLLKRKFLENQQNLDIFKELNQQNLENLNANFLQKFLTIYTHLIQ